MGFSLKGFGIGSALGGLGLGGPIGGFFGDLTKRKSYTPGRASAPATAKDIKLLDPLKGYTEANRARGQGGLDAALSGITGQNAESMKARGVTHSDYIPAELTRAGGAASRGLEDTLLGQLGGGTYDEFKKEQEHQRNLDLVNEIGALSAPTLLQEILGGLSGGAKTGLQFSQLYSALKKPQDGLEYGNYSGPRPSYGSRLNLY